MNISQGWKLVILANSRTDKRNKHPANIVFMYLEHVDGNQRKDERMTLPYRYSSNRERKHVHLRLTLEIWRKLVDDPELRGSTPNRIRMILLERYPSREKDG